MKPIERLKQYIANKGLSLNAFDKSINAANGYIGKQIKNNASIGTDVIENILSVYTDLNLGWLITGKGDMILRGNTYNNLAQLNGVAEPTNAYNNCKLCIEKEKRIDDLLKQINTLNKIIDKLTVLSDCEEKRKKG